MYVLLACAVLSLSAHATEPTSTKSKASAEKSSATASRAGSAGAATKGAAAKGAATKSAKAAAASPSAASASHPSGSAARVRAAEAKVARVSTDAPTDATLTAEAAPPAAAPPAPPAPDAALVAELAALHAEVTALRGDVAALRAPPPDAVASTPVDPAKEARRAELQAELGEVAAQRALLDQAVVGGLDSTLAEAGRGELDRREAAATAAISALDEAPQAATVEPPAAKAAWTLDAGFQSAYAFRGANLFTAGTPQDAAPLFAPSVSVALGDSGVSVGWWGGFQVGGENAAALVDAGYGAENDVIVGWSTKLGDSVTVGTALTGYLYPFATADAAGTAFPVYVEPAASITWSPGVDLGVSVAYTFGVQDALATAGRYVYVRPTVGKTIPLPGESSLSAAAGVGIKWFTAEGAPTDNVVDVAVDVAVEKDFGSSFYVKPGVHGVWTDKAGATFADTAFGWAGLNVGWRL